MDRDQLKREIEAVAKGGKIACRQAMAVADKAGVTNKEVGELLNEMKIKIVACQLGCF